MMMTTRTDSGWPTTMPLTVRLGIQSMAKDLGATCRLNRLLDGSATMCLVNRRRMGKSQHVDMENLRIQEASKSGRFYDEED